MKKFLAILMALALVLSLAACGEKAAPTTESTTEATTESTTESTSEETSESTEEPAATINKEVASYLGTVENNVYVNEAAGFSFTPAEGWTLLDMEQVQQLNTIDLTSIVDAADLKDALSTAQIIPLYAGNDDGDNFGATMSVLSEEEATMTEEELIESLIPQLEQAYASMGYTVENIEAGKVLVGDVEKACINQTMTVNDVTVYQAQIYFLFDGICYTVTYSSQNADTINNAFMMFALAA